MPVVMVDGPHPALLESARLLSQCDVRAQRRSGPGGQHRNKTSSGVFLFHDPTGVRSEATERRSQADNRAVALQRLRYQLAIEVRSPAGLDAAASGQDPLESELRQRFGGAPLRMNQNNPAKPAVLALILNDLHVAGGQPSLVARHWNTTTSSIVAFVKSHAPAFTLLNAIRQHHGRRPLK